MQHTVYAARVRAEITLLADVSCTHTAWQWPSGKGHLVVSDWSHAEKGLHWPALPCTALHSSKLLNSWPICLCSLTRLQAAAHTRDGFHSHWRASSPPVHWTKDPLRASHDALTLVHWMGPNMTQFQTWLHLLWLCRGYKNNRLPGKLSSTYVNHCETKLAHKHYSIFKACYKLYQLVIFTL